MSSPAPLIPSVDVLGSDADAGSGVQCQPGQLDCNNTYTVDSQVILSYDPRCAHAACLHAPLPLMLPAAFLLAHRFPTAHACTPVPLPARSIITSSFLGALCVIGFCLFQPYVSVYRGRLVRRAGQGRWPRAVEPHRPV